MQGGHCPPCYYYGQSIRPKSSETSGSMFDRVFITGVLPVVMSDITSGYNIAQNIYFEPEFNDLCGFKMILSTSWILKLKLIADMQILS
ncbi:hypothetical protein BuS5_01451 [Desulfosarcina sp. BuS5]|uniref:AAA family ATPase n=1 Tax=Desulfosarcina sp. BuS5 TaxID=933262 RepID=UPI002378AF15|nr:AAA family ATPase [Desulfosarcina sp. BuS5]WDN88483.1 hypothetical protein BuS5_01451 [Desulfosarcina sp. BuS5]